MALKMNPATGAMENDPSPAPGINIPSTSVLSTYTPAIGDLCYVDPADGKIKPCDSSSGTKANALLCVSGPLYGGALAQGSGFIAQMMGDEMPLSAFGALGALQAIGTVSDAYVASSATPGKIAAAPAASSGLYARKVFSIPKRFADLVAGDLTSIYVRLQHGSPVQA
jgi:hypothetical protein